MSWDNYCFVCGNPCHSMFDFVLDESLELLKKYDDMLNAKKKNYIFLRNMKLFYMMYKNNQKETIGEIKKLIKNTLWMNKCTMLLADDKVINNCKQDNSNILFRSSTKIYEHNSINNIGSYLENNYMTGIFVHSDCYKFVENKYKIKLKYSLLPIIFYSDDSDRPFTFIKYGEIENYWEQDFNFINIIIDQKQYLCASPLNGDKNIIQIKKNISQLKINNNLLRKGPSISATFYSLNTIKIGNNKKLWIIKNNKWQEINENIIEFEFVYEQKNINKKQLDFIMKLPFIAQHNNYNGIFVKSIKIGKFIELKLLTTNSFIKNINELFN